MIVTMRTRTRTGLRILFLLAFSAITLGINFLHTEKGVIGGDDCPACHFLTSSLATSPGVAIIVPDLLFQGDLTPGPALPSNDLVVLSLSSRSPPQT